MSWIITQVGTCNWLKDPIQSLIVNRHVKMKQQGLERWLSSWKTLTVKHENQSSDLSTHVTSWWILLALVTPKLKGVETWRSLGLHVASPVRGRHKLQVQWEILFQRNKAESVRRQYQEPSSDIYIHTRYVHQYAYVTLTHTYTHKWHSSTFLVTCLKMLSSPIQKAFFFFLQCLSFRIRVLVHIQNQDPHLIIFLIIWTTACI